MIMLVLEEINCLGKKVAWSFKSGIVNNKSITKVYKMKKHSVRYIVFILFVVEVLASTKHQGLTQHQLQLLNHFDWLHMFGIVGLGAKIAQHWFFGL